MSEICSYKSVVESLKYISSSSSSSSSKYFGLRTSPLASLLKLTCWLLSMLSRSVPPLPPTRGSDISVSNAYSLLGRIFFIYLVQPHDKVINLQIFLRLNISYPESYLNVKNPMIKIMQKFVNHNTSDITPNRANRFVSWSLTLSFIQCIKPNPRHNPLFTIGGNKDADIAVPTMALNPKI